MLKPGEKYRLYNGIMAYLNGYIVTIKEFKFRTGGINFYEVTIDDMNNTPLIVSEKTLETIELMTQENAQNKEWNKLSELEKQNIREMIHKHSEWPDVTNALIDKFGKHNIDSNINTWEDTFKLIQCKFDNYFSFTDTDFYRGLDILMKHEDKKLFNKIIATYKIIEIMRLGYGGVISDDEWKTYKESPNTYYSIICRDNGTILIELVDDDKPINRNILTFRSLEDAERFMDSTANFELIRQFYML